MSGDVWRDLAKEIAKTLNDEKKSPLDKVSGEWVLDDMETIDFFEKIIKEFVKERIIQVYFKGTKG